MRAGCCWPGVNTHRPFRIACWSRRARSAAARSHATTTRGVNTRFTSIFRCTNHRFVAARCAVFVAVSQCTNVRAAHTRTHHICVYIGIGLWLHDVQLTRSHAPVIDFERHSCAHSSTGSEAICVCVQANVFCPHTGLHLWRRSKETTHAHSDVLALRFCNRANIAGVKLFMCVYSS